MEPSKQPSVANRSILTGLWRRRVNDVTDSDAPLVATDMSS